MQVYIIKRVAKKDQNMKTQPDLIYIQVFVGWVFGVNVCWLNENTKKLHEMYIVQCTLL